MLKNPPRPNLTGAGGLGGLKGGFRCAGGLSAGRAPRPPKPPAPMKYIVSGNSEQLGMRARSDPTIRTAPTNVYGRVSSAWVFWAMGTRNLGIVGLRGGHGVPKYTMGLQLQHEG